LWAAEETQKGLVGLMQRMILRLLNALVAMLAERRTRRHEAEAQSAGSKACDADVEPAAADVCVADTEIGDHGEGLASEGRSAVSSGNPSRHATDARYSRHP